MSGAPPPPGEGEGQRTTIRFSVPLERALAEPRHIGRTWPRCRPMETAVLLGDLDVVDAGLAAAHQAVLVELPLLVSVGAMPLARRIMPLILEADRDAVAVECPEVLDQAIVELGGPFAREESDDRLATFEKFRAVAPAAVLGIGERNALGIARIPGVLRHAGFLGGGLLGERRQRRT